MDTFWLGMKLAFDYLTLARGPVKMIVQSYSSEIGITYLAFLTFSALAARSRPGNAASLGALSYLVLLPKLRRMRRCFNSPAAADSFRTKAQPPRKDSGIAPRLI